MNTFYLAVCHSPFISKKVKFRLNSSDVINVICLEVKPIILYFNFSIVGDAYSQDDGPLKNCMVVQIKLFYFCNPQKFSSDDFDPYTTVFQWFLLLPIHTNCIDCGGNQCHLLIDVTRQIFLKTPETPNLNFNYFTFSIRVIEISLQESSSNNNNNKNKASKKLKEKEQYKEKLQ
ncbi:hypothetical protein ACTA71_012637 [Dictyostelium dimigraforme]